MSDNYYVYSRGVEDECFDNPEMCIYRESGPSWEGIYNHPEASWIYNSDNLESQTDLYCIWTLSPNISDTSCVFCVHGGIDSSNNYDYIYDGYFYGVRPVVYLKSSINIISGEGTEQNPYILR